MKTKIGVGLVGLLLAGTAPARVPRAIAEQIRSEASKTSFYRYVDQPTVKIEPMSGGAFAVSIHGLGFNRPGWPETRRPVAGAVYERRGDGVVLSGQWQLITALNGSRR